MSEKISRRDFLKVAGMGSLTSVLLSGCGETTQRRLGCGIVKSLSEGRNIWFATTCGECPSGCGLMVNTTNGRAWRVEGNPAHPVNHGGICGRGLAALERRLSINRIQGPLRQAERDSGSFTFIDWVTASSVLRDVLCNNDPGEIAFLLGLFPDHLNDLVQLLSRTSGGIHVHRLNSSDEMEGRVTLMDATQKLFGAWKAPHFDLEHAEVIFSFGASFSESWLPPAARLRVPKHCSRLVQFGARKPDAFDSAAERLLIRPGSEAILAQALARLVSEYINGASLPAFSMIDLHHAAETSGISVNEIRRLALLFTRASRKVAIPGSLALGNTNGLAAAQAILSLNVASGNLGKVGGLFLPPDSPIYPELNNRPSTMAEVAALVDNMKRGKVKALLVHGVDPVHDLPRAFGFEEALRSVELVISFSSIYNETALHADYLLPDHTPLESWGYQRVNLGGDRTTISGTQPVVSPLFNTRATVDLLLSAAHAIGGELAASLPFANEVDFLQKSLAPLMNREGVFTAPSSDSFWTFWLRNGGWWEKTPGCMTPVVCAPFDQPWNTLEAEVMGDEGQSYYLLPFFQSNFTRREQTNYLTSQGKSEITTHGRSNIWVEMNPEAARAQGLHNNDVVKIISSVGEIQALVREVSTIRPDSVAVIIEEESSRDPSSGKNRRENPLDLVGKEQNESGDLAFSTVRVIVSGI